MLKCILLNYEKVICMFIEGTDEVISFQCNAKASD